MQPETIGARIQAARKLAGLTQRQLADRAFVSLSLVKAVEQARVPASPAFIAAAARALHVAAPELMGQPATPEPGDQRIHSVIPMLRRELAAYRMPAELATVPSLAELDTAVARASVLRHSATLDTLGEQLPGLLAQLRAAVQQADSPAEREHIHGLLAEAYAAAGQVAWKLGYADLSSLCTERIEWAAERSGDPLAVAAGDFYRAGELIAAAEWRGALAFLDTARARIADESGEAATAMHGQLHLKSGLAAARAGDPTTSDEHLAEAADAARFVTPGSDHYRLAFDATSVRIWGVGLAVERRDGTEAVKRAEGFHPAGVPSERAGHHWIDLARGHQLHGDRDRAVESLQLARRTSPQQTRFHPQVRETVLTLAERDRRRSDTLAGFARWAGIHI